VISLPAPLEAAIAEALRSLPSSQWISAAQRLSTHYRTPRASKEPLNNPQSAIRNPQSLGYAALVLPAAYAQLHGALAATLPFLPPDFHPTTLLDLGSGPGTALWAAVDHFPSLTTLTAYEREPAFIDLARRLASASDHPALRAAHFHQITLSGPLPQHAPQYDLVIIGHVLNELDEPTRHTLVASAWEHCSGLLLIVEPGTSAAFPVVRAARDHLLQLGAHTIAPCAHDNPCPLQNDWCHFPQRLNRPTFQRRAKEASAGWEEAKFSYAAMSRFPKATPIWGRLIHQPHLTKVYAQLTVSSTEGIVRPRIPKRDRPAYRAASDLKWGDALPNPIPDQL
jgi:ribosomal protein RSM22 (predicted rRNA methylase)